MARIIRKTVTVGAGSTTQNALSGTLFANLEEASRVTFFAATDNAAQNVSATCTIQGETLSTDAIVPVEKVADLGPDRDSLPLGFGGGRAGDELGMKLTNSAAGAARVEVYVLIEPI